MQSSCSSFQLLNFIHNHGLILFKSLKDSMTKKSLSNGWVVNLKDSYLFQTFSFEIFFWQVSQQQSVNRVDATEILKNGNSFKKTNPKHWQTLLFAKQ